MDILIYFGIGIILSFIVILLYSMTNSPDIEFESKILDKLGIDDEFDVALTIFVLTFLWPAVVCIGIFMGFFVGVVLLFGILINWIISAIQFVIKLFVKSKK